MRRVVSFTYAVVALLAGGVSAQQGPTEQAEFFEARIRPLFAAHCYACHSSAKAAPSAGLRLDTADGWLKGDDTGPVVRPGEVDASPLVRAVRYADPELQMPPAEPVDAAHGADDGERHAHAEPGQHDHMGDRHADGAPVPVEAGGNAPEQAERDEIGEVAGAGYAAS